MIVKRNVYIIFLILIFLIHTCNSNCGCNKLNREDNSNLELDSVSEEVLNVKEYNYPEEPEDVELCSIKEDNKWTEDKNKLNIDDMSPIPGGRYSIGTNTPIFPEDKESPERIVEIQNFYLDKYEVSNRKFKEFVDNTGYITDAEKFKDSFVFKGLLTKELQDEYIDFRVVNALWWYKIIGVDWKHPEGPETNISDRWDHPVVHVSWRDAIEFCKWQNKRLPTEGEWEIACRGGRKGKLFPWGDKLNPKNEHWLNIWQGDFPDNNTEEDGCLSTCAVDKFHQNKYDLYNIVGNVWEWTSELWNPNESKKENAERVKKGGSYLCHKSYCYRYRCAARSQNTEDSSAGNLGFRCAADM